jgi:preprotein translocase subunit YajC
MQYLPIIVIALAFYFILIRPRSKAQAATRKISLTQGDDVVSNGGIFGVVVKSFEQRVWVEVAPSVEMIFDRRSLTRLDPAVVDAMEDAENQADALSSFDPSAVEQSLSLDPSQAGDDRDESFDESDLDDGSHMNEVDRAQDEQVPEGKPEEDEGSTEQKRP